MKLNEAEKQFPNAFAMIEARAAELERVMHADLDLATASVVDADGERWLHVMALADGGISDGEQDYPGIILRAPLDGMPADASVH